MHESIIINCSIGDAIPVDKDWLWMEQIIKDDMASVADVAELVDELYDRDPCIEVRETLELSEDEQPTSDDLLAVASDVFDLEECNRRKSGTYLARIKIARSDPDQPYTLRMNVGKVVKTEIITEERSDNYDVDGESYVQLKYPVTGEDIRVSWLNTNNGAGPQIKLIGNTAFWGGNVTGTFRIEYTTRYDVVTIEVPGIPNYDGSPLGETQESNLLAFYLYIVYPLTISPPDYSGEPALAEICGWTDEIAGSGEEEPEPIPEPPPPPEYGCVEESLMMGDPFFYQEYCCDWPVAPNPNACAVRTEPNPGGKTLPQETIEKLTREWPGPIEFIGVGPEGVEGCGKIYYRQKAIRKICCNEIDPMVWDSDNPAEVIYHGSRVLVGAVGGRPPYNVKISGEGFTLDGGRKQEDFTNSSLFWVYASETSCGWCPIEINDGCSTIRHGLRSTLGEWRQNIGATPGAVTGTLLHQWGEQTEQIIGKYKIRQGVAENAAGCAQSWQAPCTDEQIAQQVTNLCGSVTYNEPPVFALPDGLTDCGTGVLWSVGPAYIPGFPPGIYAVYAWKFIQYVEWEWVC